MYLPAVEHPSVLRISDSARSRVSVEMGSHMRGLRLSRLLVLPVLCALSSVAHADPVSDAQSFIKNQRRTQLALEGESPRTRLMQLIDDVETRGRLRTSTERMAAVEAVSAESIAQHLARFPITGEGLLLSIGPRPWP